MQKFLIMITAIASARFLIAGVLILLSLLSFSLSSTAGEFEVLERADELTEETNRTLLFSQEGDELNSETEFFFRSTREQFSEALEAKRTKKLFKMQVRLFDKSWEPTKELHYREGQVGEQAVAYTKSRCRLIDGEDKVLNYNLLLSEFSNQVNICVFSSANRDREQRRYDLKGQNELRVFGTFALLDFELSAIDECKGNDFYVEQLKQLYCELQSSDFENIVLKYDFTDKTFDDYFSSLQADDVSEN